MRPSLASALMIWSVLARLDRGEHLDIDEVGRRVDDGSLFEWLDDLYSLRVGIEAATVLLEEFQNLHSVVSPSRKFGVSVNGWALILAWCVELYQQAIPD